VSGGGPAGTGGGAEAGTGGGAGREGGGGMPVQPSSSRLVGTLGLLSVVAGVAIVLVHAWAQPRIEAHQREELRLAIEEVLGEPQRYETRWIRDGRLLDSLPAGADSSAASPVYAGFDANGRLVGYAIPGQKAGYQDVVRLIFGYDPDAGKVLGMKVLESKETPGLGAKITSDSAFIHGFDGVEAPIEGVKHPARDAHQVDMITGATISSTTVISIINDRLEAVGPVLSKAGTRTATAAGSPGADAPRTAAAAGPGPRAAGPGQGGGER